MCVCAFVRPLYVHAQTHNGTRGTHDNRTLPLSPGAEDREVADRLPAPPGGRAGAGDQGARPPRAAATPSAEAGALDYPPAGALEGRAMSRPPLRRVPLF